MQDIINGRCGWCGTYELYVKYHDEEWGKTVTDDKTLFEFLVLESAQAGLSWITILKKREGYRKAFCNFDAAQVAQMTDEDVERLMHFDGIVKNRLKIMTANPSAVAVSIHLNKFPQSRIKGAQVFYAPKSPGSEELAQTIQDNFRGLLQPENTRQIKKADSSLFLLYNNTVTPAVLVECGFLSNPEEAALLASEDYQDRVAFAICCSLLEFYDGSFEEETPDDPSKA